MSRLLSPGPVFVYESLAASRRWQQYALRGGFVFALLAGLGLVWVSSLPNNKQLANGSIKQLARMGEQFYYAIAIVQLAVVLIAAPAATAGAICIDRARGTLTHMMVTDLTDSEIVIGKLAARLVVIFKLVLCALPVMALAGLLGGIILESLVDLMLITVAVAILGCALAMAISVRASKTHEVLMVVYMIWVFWILGLPVWELIGGLVIPSPPQWLWNTNPFVLAYSPYGSAASGGEYDIAIFLAWTVALSLGLATYAVWKLRAEKTVATNRLARLDAAIRRFSLRWMSWRRGPSLDSNPVLWREWHRARPSRMARIVWGLYWLLAIVGFCLALSSCLFAGPTNVLEEVGLLNGLQVFIGLLLLSLAAPTALADERVRGSLDVLLATPLSSRSIVLAKWWGVYRQVPKLVILPAALAILIAASVPESTTRTIRAFGSNGKTTNKTLTSHISSLDRVCAAGLPTLFILAHGAAVTSFGLAMAVWFKRVGRSVTASVSAYVVFGIVSPLGSEILAELVIYLLAGNQSFGTEHFYESLLFGLISLSPVGSQIGPLFGLEDQFNTVKVWHWMGQLAALLVVMMFALGMLGLILLTFDRCMGRASEVPGKARTEPAMRKHTRRKRNVRRSEPVAVET